MREKRYIGIDLHRRKFTCCVGLENGGDCWRERSLERLAQFAKRLRPTDEVAVEVTGNTRLFYEAVAPHVARVVGVDPNQFRVINHSVKKTDPNDARNLALYLAKGLLPEVRMKEKAQAEVASLTQTRDRLAKLRTALKNKVNNLLSARGIELEKEDLSSEKGLSRVLEQPIEGFAQVEQEISRGAASEPESEHCSAGAGHRGSWRPTSALSLGCIPAVEAAGRHSRGPTWADSLPLVALSFVSPFSILRCLSPLASFPFPSRVSGFIAMNDRSLAHALTRRGSWRVEYGAVRRT